MSTLNIVKKFFPKVQKVVDVRINAVIEVTAKDASSKAVKQHDACAMAVACKRKFHLDGVIISRSMAYLIKGKQARRFHLNDSVAREVVSFDRGSGFATGKYELSHISPSALRGARETRTNSKVKRTGKDNDITKSGRFRHLTTGIRSVLGGQKVDG